MFFQILIFWPIQVPASSGPSGVRRPTKGAPHCCSPTTLEGERRHRCYHTSDAAQPRLNVPSPGFRNCPQNYHPGTRLKKGLFHHLLLTWYWAGWCRLFKKFKTYGSPLWVTTPPFPDLTSFIAHRTPPLPDFCIPSHPPQNIALCWIIDLNCLR